jgi:hypothetical protein
MQNAGAHPLQQWLSRSFSAPRHGNHPTVREQRPAPTATARHSQAKRSAPCKPPPLYFSAAAAHAFAHTTTRCSHRRCCSELTHYLSLLQLPAHPLFHTAPHFKLPHRQIPHDQLSHEQAATRLLSRDNVVTWQVSHKLDDMCSSVQRPAPRSGSIFTATREHRHQPSASTLCTLCACGMRRRPWLQTMWTHLARSRVSRLRACASISLGALVLSQMNKPGHAARRGSRCCAVLRLPA